MKTCEVFDLTKNVKVVYFLRPGPGEVELPGCWVLL